MDRLKEIIKDSNPESESIMLPEGHKERFFKKLYDRRAGREELRQLKTYLAIAAALSFIIVAPLIKISISNKESAYEIGYKGLVEEKISKLQSMAVHLDPFNQSIVLSTLEQLTYEAVPFEDQLPEVIDSQKRMEYENRYYKSKLEGVERVDQFISQLTKK